jgi:hypothetical protein
MVQQRPTSSTYAWLYRDDTEYNIKGEGVLVGGGMLMTSDAGIYEKKMKINGLELCRKKLAETALQK